MATGRPSNRVQQPSQWRSRARSSRRPAEEIARGPRTGCQIAITFDCDPWAESRDIQAVLAALDKAAVRATFFVTGQHPDILRQVAARHELGNHSVVAHQEVGQEGIGGRQIGDPRQPQLLDQAVLEGAPQPFDAPFAWGERAAMEPMPKASRARANWVGSRRPANSSSRVIGALVSR